MRLNHMITAVDTHAGTPMRVITGGIVDVPGATIFEKMQWLQAEGDGLRRRMLREPRGYPAMCCNLILPPSDPEADAGFVIMEQTEYPAMSGGNTIAVATVLLETGMLGAFISLDLFLFYIFWELMLIPMYFLIGIWGGKNRIYAAIKFFLFTALGSLLMLVAIIYVYYFSVQAGVPFENGFSIAHFAQLDIPAHLQAWLFAAFAFSFAIKVPMFPVHTWLPDAHTEAPTAGSVILAAILLKMGTYGYVRFAIPLFPVATMQFTPFLALLAVIGIIYGALVAMMQDDVKKLVAYSSVSHLGFVMLGIFAMNLQGMSGGMLQMINHGISTGALFLIVGFIYERRHTRLIADFGGLSKVMPVFATIFMIVTFSSVGLPGTNGFVGEFLILVGAFESELRVFTVFATTGVILAAVYMLWMFQRVMMGKVTNPKNEELKDLSAREVIIMLPLILFIFWIGFYPNTFLEKMNPSIDNLINQVKEKQQVAMMAENMDHSVTQVIVNE